MEESQEKRGIVKKTCDFVADHVGEFVIATVGIMAGICMSKTTKNTIARQNQITEMQREQHEARMQLYEKAKYSDNTNVNINL